MLSQWLKQSAYTVVFTGAGMSTESGVPDFRSATGLWKTSNPQKLASTEAMKHNREQFVQFYRKRTYSTEYYINEQLYCQCGGFLRPSVVLVWRVAG